MLKIKLTRIGKKGHPQYRVVVQEAKSKISGTAKAQLGYYNPLSTPAEFRLDRTAYNAWVARGAQPTPTIRQLVKKMVIPADSTPAKPVKPIKSTKASAKK